jgi:hypothetical protein
METAAEKPNDDGMSYPPKGARNIYTCKECHSHIVTQDADEGVTPFGIKCKAPGCDGTMYSSMYRVFDQSMRAYWEWYRPTVLEVLTPGERAHVDQGGLLLREATSYISGMSMEDQILRSQARAKARGEGR